MPIGRCLFVAVRKLLQPCKFRVCVVLSQIFLAQRFCGQKEKTAGPTYRYRRFHCNNKTVAKMPIFYTIWKKNCFLW